MPKKKMTIEKLAVGKLNSPAGSKSKNRFVTYEEFLKLEARVAALEKKLGISR